MSVKDLDQEIGTLVEEFIVAFGASLDSRLWIKLMAEEGEELREQMDVYAQTGSPEDKAKMLKELVDCIYVFTGFDLVTSLDSIERCPISEEEKLEWYKCIDEVHRVGINCLDEYFDDDELLLEAVRRVHASNMSKLGDDGKPIRREDGKVMKGPNYKEPDLSDLV